MMEPPSDQSSSIRCPNCDHLNPAEALVCEHCGALLPDSSPADDSDPFASLRDQDDPFASLRDEFDNGGSSTKPTGPLQEPEPDFTIGRVEQASAGKDTAPRAQTPTSPPPASQEGVPNWLSNSAPPAPHASASPIPNWLRHAQPPAPAAPVSTIPSWLSGAAPAPQPAHRAQQPTTPSESQEPSLDEAFDWLSDSTPEPIKIPTEAAEEPPGWMADLEPEQEETSDWMTALDAEPAAEGAGLLDRLGSLEEPVKAPEETTEPEEEIPDWPSSAAGAPPATEPESTSPSREAEEPDWLSELAGVSAEPAPPPVSTAGTPADMELPEEPVPAAEEETPDWLSELGAPSPEQPESEPIPDWMSGLSEPAEEETPDWLAELGEPTSVEAPEEPAEPVPVEEEAEGTPEEVPDWLSELTPPSEAASPTGEAAAITTEEIPGMMAEAEAAEQPEPLPPRPERPPRPPRLPEAAADSPIPAELITAGTPSWLQPGGEQPLEPSAVEEEATSPGEETAPEWLAEIEQAEAAAAPEPTAGAEEGEIPEWMAELDAAETPAPTEGATAETTEEVPDWMAEIEAAESAASAEPAPSAPVGEEEVPDWIAEIDTDEAPPEAAPAAEEGEIPEWMAELDAAGPVETAAPSAPAEAEEVPDWLAEIEEGAEAAAPVEEETPDWMAELEQGAAPSVDEPSPAQPPPPAEPSAPPEAATPPPADLLPGLEPVEEPAGEDWFDSFDFEGGMALPGLEDIAAGGEDLLGLTEEITVPIEAEEAQPVDLSQLPAWLRGLDEEGVPTDGSLAASAATAPELNRQIQNLRFGIVTGQAPRLTQEKPESVGALKDVAGVIQPELIFEGSTLVAPRPVENLQITEAQQQQIEIIKKLVAEEEHAADLSTRHRPLPILRWAAAIILIAAVVVPAVLGYTFLPAPAPSAQARQAYDTLQGLSDRPTKILLAVEYEPDTAAELQPLGEAIVDHLAGLDNVTVYAISTKPTGPAMAEALFNRDTVQGRLAADGGTWVDLGYLPGKATGVSQLTGGASPGEVSPMAADVLGRPTGLETDRLADGGVDAIIVIAARFDDVKMWVEQAGQPTGVPVIGGMSVSAVPLAQPYWLSGQLAAVLSGVNDAVGYRALSGESSDPAVTVRWNAQAVGGVAAVLIILVGGLVNGLASRRQHQEQ